MPHAHSSVAEIFSDAVALRAGDERAAYLDSACGTNSELRKRVERLLQADNKAHDFLESPAHAIAPTIVSAPVELPGSRIGPYKLLQQIGEGGMGTVYMAEQEQPVHRKVALKIIKPGMDSGQVIARFEAERQALAMMDHVNIARVLDAGTTEQGRPYFVMELVNGVSITSYCDDNRLTPRERLELFVPVCHAIQHAHQKGIIHRDIKPSNVMVTLYDGKPVPKVIDFGVAKATEQKLTERTLFTQYGTMIGTLEYMSPEQAEMSALGVDTRSDIYSLGVLLYELLTGSTPLSRKRIKEAAFAEILRLIKEEEPPKPSTRLSDSGEALASISALRQTEPGKLSKVMRGELDWIVMKTLEKDRNRRYETANGFAADVQRYLNDEPVQACPPSAGYRLRKFMRRNRLAMVSTAVVTVALAFGTILSAWQAVRATRAQIRADMNFRIAESQRERAERHFRSARDAMNYMTEVGQEGLILIPNTEKFRRELLEKSLEVYQTFTEEESDDPAVRQEVGRAYMRVGWIHRNMGNTAKATDSYQEAIHVFEGLLAEFPDEPDYRNDFARGQAKFGLMISSRLPEAKQALSRATEIQKELVTEYPDRLAFKTDLIESQHYYAWVLMYNTTAPDMAQAEKILGQIQVLQKMEPVDQRPDHNTDALMGDVFFNTGRLQEAEMVWRRSLASYQKRLIDSPANPVYRSEVAHRYENLGWLLERTGRLEEAEQSFRQSVSIRQKLTGEFPDAIEHDGMLYRTTSELIALLQRTGQSDKSLEVYEEALSLRQEALGPSHPKTVASMNTLAWLLATFADAEIRNPQRAVELAEQAVELIPNASNLNTLGVAHYRAGDWQAAIDSLESSEKLQPGDNLGFNGIFLAMSHDQLGHQEEARKWYENACAWTEKNRANDEELRRFRTEAEELLKISTDLPPNDSSTSKTPD